ncbi:class I SAM-dependent methyltransferase [Streptomyces armeniacus]|uniref:Class I SAM-dependent methyltransferase n=2 Tax=Streptomyces armeniacus TaxID=83291 RepID=A0A345XZN2_9ACTN|nr:class I SAM-dependent methyltransferase [Streptomyces armeniacus]
MSGFGRSDSFNEFYEGTPPWEIAAPQPAVVALADRGLFTGRVLDVGCGTGENTLHLASRGHTVLGVDGAENAVVRAREKARQRDLPVEFAIADAFDLTSLGQKFDTVLDSAFMHIPGNTAGRRRDYTRELANVLVSDGWVHLLEISERSEEHPTLTRTEIVAAFDDEDWTDIRIGPTTYAVTTGDVHAWLVSVRRRQAAAPGQTGPYGVARS